MFSTTMTYAVRALSHLAGCEDRSSVLGRDLAQASGVPANYLSKILLSLKKAGIVEASRGTGGGYRLRRPAAEVSLAQVVEVFDPVENLPDCLLGRPECRDEDPCPAHERWCRVKAAYLDFLRETTLAEISNPAFEL